jgi:hypothetical protein
VRSQRESRGIILSPPPYSDQQAVEGRGEAHCPLPLLGPIIPTGERSIECVFYPLLDQLVYEEKECRSVLADALVALLSNTNWFQRKWSKRILFSACCSWNCLIGARLREIRMLVGPGIDVYQSGYRCAQVDTRVWVPFLYPLELANRLLQTNKGFSRSVS